MSQLTKSRIEYRELRASDWEAARAIYAEGIATGNATFESSVPEWPEWDAAHLPICRLAACDGDRVLGWAALSPVSKRKVYAGVAEASVYIAECARGKGVGSSLLRRLIHDSEAAGIWTLQASIFPENSASLALVQRAGFRIVGRRERIACVGGRWRDTLILERRSPAVGC